jgi:hypothetical protein
MPKLYDRIIKENLQSILIEFVRVTTDRDIVSYRVVFPEFPQTIERTADFVIEVTNSRGEKELLQLEFQSTNDKAMSERMHLYLALLYKIYKLPIRQVVFYIGKNKMNM